jgi:hypothetical protein
MKKSDLIKLRNDYTFFRKMLFNDDIPDVSKIDFTLNNLTYAIAYSKHNQTPRKTGNIHEISFSKIYLLNDNEMQSVLIHEMIHLWQDTHISEDRYKICSHAIAHDKVFVAKMNTINMILVKNMYDIKLSVVADQEYPIDPICEAKTSFNVIFIEDKNSGSWYSIKCYKKYKDNILKKLEHEDYLFIDKIYIIETTSYKFAKQKFVRSIKLQSANDLYKEFLNDPSIIWVKK